MSSRGRGDLHPRWSFRRETVQDGGGRSHSKGHQSPTKGYQRYPIIWSVYESQDITRENSHRQDCKLQGNLPMIVNFTLWYLCMDLLPLWNLSAEPVQKYPIFFGLMSLGVNGGLSRGGVGTCRIGRGGALVVRASVTPGMVGMSGGKDRHSPRATRDASEATYFIVRANERVCVVMSRFAGIPHGLNTQQSASSPHFRTLFAFPPKHRQQGLWSTQDGKLMSCVIPNSTDRGRSSKWRIHS